MSLIRPKPAWEENCPKCGATNYFSTRNMTPRGNGEWVYVLKCGCGESYGVALKDMRKEAIDRIWEESNEGTNERDCERILDSLLDAGLISIPNQMDHRHDPYFPGPGEYVPINGG